MEGTEASEACVRAAVPYLPVPVLLLNSDTLRVEEINKQGLSLLKRPENDVIGKFLFDVCPELLAQPIHEKLNHFARSTSIEHEQQVDGYLKHDEQKKWVHFTFQHVDAEVIVMVIQSLNEIDSLNQSTESPKQVLPHNEQSVRQLFMQTPVGIGVLKGEKLIIDLVNDAMLSYWKRSREDVINKPLWDVFPEIALQGFNQITDNVYKTGEGYFSPETPVEMFRNGKLETIYINFAFEPLRDDNGEVYGLLTIGNEVTDLVIARKKSESNEARLQNLADSMPQLVWIADEHGRVSYYNNQVQKFAGVIQQHDGTWEWKGILHPDDSLPTAMAWQKSLTENTVYQIEHRAKMIDGSFRWHLSRAYPQMAHDGTTTWYGTATDIQQVKDAERAARESEERFRIMADATPSIIWALNPEGLHRYLNRFALEYLGIKEDEVATLRWSTHIHPDDFEITQHVLTNAIRTRTSYSHEHRLRRYDGEYRWFLAQGAPTYYSNGELSGYVGSGTDIHESKLAREILLRNEEVLENLVKERTEELRRSNDDLQQFAHVASHDLKEPIRKIKTFCHKLQKDFGSVLNDQGNHLLERIMSSVDRMFSMVTAVLNYSSVTATRSREEYVELGNIIKDVCDDLELLIEEKNATVRYGNLPAVCADKDRIHQLFYNLINNSLKFSRPESGVLIQISWRPTTVNQRPYVEITLSDNGIGFDMEYAEKIFGSFVRLHPKDRFEGSGLGLALCKRIVEQYDGTISAHGEDGKGATFVFTLPTENCSEDP